MGVLGDVLPGWGRKLPFGIPIRVHPLMYSDGAGTERDSGHLALVVLCAYKGVPWVWSTFICNGIRQVHLHAASVAIDKSGCCCKSGATLHRLVRCGFSMETPM